VPRNGDVESIRRLQQVHCAGKRPTCGVVEARSLTGIDDFQPTGDAKIAGRQMTQKPEVILPLEPSLVQMPASQYSGNP
jgi:hypothetical protein